VGGYFGNLLKDQWDTLMRAPPNYALQRPCSPSSRSHARSFHSAMPSARLKRLRPAAQRER
jgi:hypothetical protein